LHAPYDVAYAPGSITTSRVAGSELQGLLRKALVGSTGAICRSSRRSQAADPARAFPRSPWSDTSRAARVANAPEEAPRENPRGHRAGDRRL